VVAWGLLPPLRSAASRVGAATVVAWLAATTW